MKAKLKYAPACAVLLFFAAAILVFPQRYMTACFNGLCLWAECVLPSLFPFTVITLILIKTGALNGAARPFKRFTKIFNLPQVAPPLMIMSVCSGYPTGSKFISEYREGGLLSASDCKKLAPLCSACGPLFALGTIGGKAFQSAEVGIKLFAACLVSVTLTSLLYAKLTPKRETAERAVPLRAKEKGNLLYDSFYGAVIAVIVAGGFISFFYTLSQVFADFGIFQPLSALLTPVFGAETAQGFCLGLIEATGGAFRAASGNNFFTLPVTGFLVTFGGASILCQQLCYLTRCRVPALFFIAFKLLQGVVCFALLCLFSLI